MELCPFQNPIQGLNALVELTYFFLGSFIVRKVQNLFVSGAKTKVITISWIDVIGNIIVTVLALTIDGANVKSIRQWSQDIIIVNGLD